MSGFIEELFLRLACETPLPRSSAAGRRADKPFTTKPYTRAQAKVEQQAELLPSPHLQSSTTRKKRARKSEFDIFIDADAANTPLSPSPKKLKSNGRVPLSVRTNSGNDTPVPSPRFPNTPFPFSRSDPLWENVENYDTRPFYMTPPPTPGGPSPAPSPSPFASSYRATRSARTRRVSSTKQLPPPKDKTLYTVLQLDDWKATKEEIKIAYRKVAVDNHPDKVAEGQREDATHMMQTVNAAKEVLLDDKRRRAYHSSGKLPWNT
ncbi:DnaJ-domain-containing protein [Macroventuria anomochaeta]|uniref:DnaJ-domain-containing protein n=1 Tax=Macroventuria anomochaeta TaxID=301207 RepID=A0ACB6RRD3_9PLEO|nr:DnaJ-domain-containing protein [Macroventuria anomochaeta]KAF2623497.1 DnaJ-domain-containing protein [Macroventuria anomochaeta]